MRIYGPNGTSVVGGASQARRAGGGTFSLDQTEESRPSKPTSSVRTIGGIDVSFTGEVRGRFTNYPSWLPASSVRNCLSDMFTLACACSSVTSGLSRPMIVSQ